MGRQFIKPNQGGSRAAGNGRDLIHIGTSSQPGSNRGTLGYRHTRSNCYEHSAFMMNPREVSSWVVPTFTFQIFYSGSIYNFPVRKICSSQPQCGCKHSAVKISSFLFSRTKNIPRTGWRMSEYGFSPRKRMRYKSWRFWFIAPSSIHMTVVFLSPPSLYRHHYHHHSYHLHAHLTSVEMDTDLNWGNQKSSISTIRPSLNLTEGPSCIIYFFYENSRLVTVTNINIWLNFETDTLDFCCSVWFQGTELFE